MTSVLVVTATPDERPSTEILRQLVEHLDQRDGVRIETWFLRKYRFQEPWPGTRVVDDLRTKGLTGLLRRLHVPLLPSFIAGRVLRHWLRRLDPDVVLLDDGLGSRVLGGQRRSPAIVVRLNELPPQDAEFEGAAATTADLALIDRRTTSPRPDAPVRDSTPLADFDDYADAMAVAERAVAERRRQRHGIPDGVPLLTGWGDDGWLDGPDVFVRCLWALEQRYGVIAHGLWIGVGSPDDRRRLESEARRCGVADRYHLVDGDEVDRFCGDAVFLPWRTDGERLETIWAVMTGLKVTAFPTVGFDDEAVTIVDHLDVDGAAQALSAGSRSTMYPGRF